MSDNHESNILVILINYFNDNEVVGFITNQLSKQQYVKYDIVIVNNGSNDFEKLKNLKLNNNSFHVIEPDRNLGYLNGAKLAFDFYCKSKPVPDFTILCNTDITFENGYFLERIVNDPANKKAEVIGPAIFSTLTSHQQNPIYEKRLSSKKIQFLLHIYNYYPLYIIYQLGTYLKRLIKKSPSNNSQEPKYVYAVHGSFLIFTKYFFEKGNTLTFPAFMYSEELFIAEQCLNTQSKIY